MNLRRSFHTGYTYIISSRGDYGKFISNRKENGGTGVNSPAIGMAGRGRQLSAMNKIMVMIRQKSFTSLNNKSYPIPFTAVLSIPNKLPLISRIF